MKHIILLLFVLATVFNACTGTRPNQVSENNKTNSGNAETSQVGTNGTSDHYVVNMKFTKEQAVPETGVREAGEAALLVIPSSQMFLAIYEGGQLTYYYDFPDPLRSQGAGGAGGMATSASGALIFPAWMADRTRADKAEVGIYTVSGYTDAFADQVQNSNVLKNAITKGTFKKAYALNGANMGAFLRNIK
jgi:hypothetical protein